MRIACALALLVLSFGATSCQKSEKSAFSFREVAFCAEVSWERNGETFCARIYNKPSQKLQISALDVALVGEEEQRYAEYVLPSELKGIRAEISKDKKAKISLGNSHVSSGGAKELTAVLELIFGQGSARVKGREEINGSKCDVYSAVCELGGVTYFIDSQTKFPKRIVFKETDFNFVWVESGHE